MTDEEAVNKILQDLLDQMVKLMEKVDELEREISCLKKR